MFLTFLGLVHICLVGCSTAEKSCSDDVCKITEHGEVRYEGDKDKIAKILNHKKYLEEQKLLIQKMYLDAPSRSKDEKIRLAILAPKLEGENLEPLKMGYYKWILKLLAKYESLQILNPKDVDSAVNRYLKEKKSKTSEPINNQAEDIYALKKLGLPADIVVFLKFKAVPLVVKNVPSTSLTNIEFSASFSSVFAYENIETKNHVGQSYNDPKRAGMKSKSGKALLDRNPKKDLDAITVLTGEISESIEAKVRPKLPSLAAIEKIQKRDPAAHSTSQADKDKKFEAQMLKLYSSE